MIASIVRPQSLTIFFYAGTAKTSLSKTIRHCNAFVGMIGLVLPTFSDYSAVNLPDIPGGARRGG